MNTSVTYTPSPQKLPSGPTPVNVVPPPEAPAVNVYLHSRVDLDLVDLELWSEVIWANQQENLINSSDVFTPLSVEKGPARAPRAWLCCPQYAL